MRQLASSGFNYFSKFVPCSQVRNAIANTAPIQRQHRSHSSSGYLVGVSPAVHPVQRHLVDGLDDFLRLAPVGRVDPAPSIRSRGVALRRSRRKSASDGWCFSPLA